MILWTDGATPPTAAARRPLIVGVLARAGRAWTRRRSAASASATSASATSADASVRAERAYTVQSWPGGWS